MSAHTVALPAASRKGLASRAIGAIVSPRATYADVAAHPRVAGALCLVLLISVATNAALLSTTVGKDAFFDAQVRSLKSFGVTVTAEMSGALESNVARAPIVAGIGSAVSLILFGLLLAGGLLGTFTAIMGGDATFKEVYAVVVHSGFILALQRLFVTPLDYARGELGGASTLAVFFPNADEGGLAARLSGSIDLFLIWWLINLAIGIGVLYKKRTGPIATTFVATYVAIAAVVSVVRTVVAGV